MQSAKILLLTNACTVGGAEMHLLSLAKNLNKGKYDLHLAYLKERPDTARPMKIDFINAGVKVFDLESRHKFDPQPLYRLTEIIKKFKIDIVHTHLFQAELLGALGVSFHKRPVFISTYHSTEAFLKNVFWANLAKFSTGKADQIIVISDAVGSFIQDKIGIGREKIKRIYYGLDANQTKSNDNGDIRSEYGINADTPIIGIIARYAPQKGHKYLLDAMPHVLHEHPRAVLFSAGHDEKGIKWSLEEYARKLGISDNVIFTDFRSDIYNILSKIDLFVLPSLWEGFGLVLLEAMAARKAIVATNVGPIPEVVVDGVTGLLVEPKKPKAMAEKIVYLLNSRYNGNLMRKMGDAGEKRLRQVFTVKKMIKETESVYDYWLQNKLHLGENNEVQCP